LLRTLPSLSGERDEKLTRIGGQPPLMTAFPTACPFAPRCSHATDRCLCENPSLVPVEEGHEAACWLLATDARKSEHA